MSQNAEYVADPDAEHVDFMNELMARADDSWDGDESMESLCVAYVRHLEDEVQRLEGCRRKWCRQEDDEFCDHGWWPAHIDSSGEAP